MKFTTVLIVLISGLLIYVETVPIGDRKNEEISDEQDEDFPTAGNDTFSESMGPPDSHEAMNNREINLKQRKKRSYEFLMGLINNNSKLEVTKVDPGVAGKVTDENIAESELLLELMVKIASHPEKWNKVHQLLSKIENDLKTSKTIVENLKNNVKKEQSDLKLNTWPKFDLQEEDSKKLSAKYHEKSGNKSTYPKNFSYHRVTGKPFYLNKNPKAYIAVSVIAPKPMNKIRSLTTTTTSSDDLQLENELQQLKPWTHEQNLKNMEKIRSNWVIQTDLNDKNKSVAPNPL